MQTESVEPEKMVPKLFGLRYHQLIAVLVGFIAATQLYSWMAPIPVGGHDIRLYLCLLIALLGPAYCLVYRKEVIDIKSIWPRK
ncbi:MAG: hypothetical protein WC028_05910 [Candidatus Obscuribacterales bacterium]|jgi:hypothetical protein